MLYCRQLSLEIENGVMNQGAPVANQPRTTPKWGVLHDASLSSGRWLDEHEHNIQTSEAMPNWEEEHCTSRMGLMDDCRGERNGMSRYNDKAQLAKKMVK